ncbi:HNH endonuclease [Dietzia lutea]|uniref:HNH endonuclease n=1 Tax=Dietzia lutea TaxID=546160 RepID=UPI000D558AE7|nr:HNH endonuclease [Dietzia lutea]
MVRPPNWTYDEIAIAAAVAYRAGWKYLGPETVEVQELSAVLNAADIHPLVVRGEDFRNPNGVARKMSDVATHRPDYTGKPTRGGKTDRLVLEELLADPEIFLRKADSIRASLEAREPVHSAFPMSDVVDDVDFELEEASEGRVLLARHLRRERDPKLRRAKIAHVRKAGKPLACDVCEFDFEATYGERGRDYIEVHHVKPLSESGETTTKLSDLALLCSNCHRMVHRTPWTTPAELRGVRIGSMPQREI